MAEQISRAESAEQRKQLQALMMEALCTDFPDIGLLVTSDEPELLAEYLARAKREDPELRNMIIGLRPDGVIIYHDHGREVNPGHVKESTDDT